jgi:hypothetical protein
VLCKCAIQSGWLNSTQTLANRKDTIMAEVNLLTTEAQAKLGMTHEVIITHEDLDTAAATETIEVTIPVKAGQIVLGGPHILVEDFDSPSSSGLVYSVGDGDDDDIYLTNTEIDTAGTEVDYKLPTNTGITYGKLYAVDDTIDFSFTATGDNLEDFTAGKLLYYFKLMDLPALKN